MVDQPHAVGREKEVVRVGLVHGGGLDPEDEGLASALADLLGGLKVLGQVDVSPAALDQALLEDLFAI